MIQSGEPPIFIVGMPRSGTTLLTTILSAHPRIAVSPESHFLTYWVPTYGHLKLDQPGEFQQFWQVLSQSQRFSYFDIEPDTTLTNILAKGSPSHGTLFAGWLETYAQRCHKPRWGEKTPLHYQHLAKLLEWFPQAQVLWMLRDPRAVTASLLNMTWASNYVHVHAEQWHQSTQLYEQNWHSDPRVKLVRYEDLVHQPESVLEGIFEFLNEDYPRGVWTQRSTQTMPIVNREGWALAHLNQALQPLETRAVDKWKQQLWPHHVAIVNSVTNRLQQQYGYTDEPYQALSPGAVGLLKVAKLRCRLDCKLMVWRTKLLGPSSRRAQDIGAMAKIKKQDNRSR
ncbi:sulfotransferase family protein [Leptothoe sp. PORK10 BA2]|uniref:sulfotransferase family protein n=1 Tax=Leptothoe sp. PORK10 BA2 TaxID=3110254 RepID=UPI002B1EC8A1|nr:sulfotransferase [Leptothoe sp. PORK10 BA2]MEA5462454.1 sulfotransferase [Leptothoe sp. PORK10 BA2]